MSLLREQEGKVSFGRVFSAALVTSVLVGWWIAGFALWGFTLPEITTELFAWGVGLTYGANKLSNALMAIGQRKANG